MKTLPAIALCALTTLTLQACSKKDDNGGSNNNGSKPVSEKIVGNWRVESKTLVYTNPDGSQGNVYDHLHDCEKDDVYTFNNDGTSTISDGSDVCGNGGYGLRHVWTVPTDSTLDSPYGPARQGISLIEQLDNSVMKLSAPIPPNGRLTYIFRRK